MKELNLLIGLLFLLSTNIVSGQDAVVEGRNFGFWTDTPDYDTTGTFTNFQKDNKYGFKNSKTGAIVIPAVYDWYRAFDNRSAIVQKDKMHGVVTFENITVIPFKYNYIYYEKNLIHGVKKDETADYYDRSNYKFLFSINNPVWRSFFENEIARSESKDTVYIYNRKGNVISTISKKNNPAYGRPDTILRFIEPNELVIMLPKDSFNKVEYFRCSPDLKKCRLDPLCSIAGGQETFKVFSKNLFLIRERDQSGYYFYDSTGTKLMEEKFNPIGPNTLDDRFYNGRMLIQSKALQLYGYADLNGKLVIPFNYSMAFPFSDSLAAFLDSATMTLGFIDLHGRVVINPMFHAINYYNHVLGGFGFSNGLCKIYHSNTNFQNPQSGNFNPYKFTYISYYNKKGEEVIKLDNDIIEATDFVNNRAEIKNNRNQVAVINKAGTIVEPFK